MNVQDLGYIRSKMGSILKVIGRQTKLKVLAYSFTETEDTLKGYGETTRKMARDFSTIKMETKQDRFGIKEFLSQN